MAESDAISFGVLVLHGFTGAPPSVEPVAVGLAAAGFAVDVPLLPGHGTTPQDLDAVRYGDWVAEVERHFAALAARCRQVGVFGLSMGGGLALRLCATHPEIVGAALVNPFAEPVDAAFVELLAATIASGARAVPSIGSDIARQDPPASGGYDETPVLPLRSLIDGVAETAGMLARVTCPVLLCTSRVDHVVPTSTGAYLEAVLGGPVERIMLERSYHVATLDHDGPEIVRRTVEFMEGLAR